jgi:hypothetical protein
LLAQDVSSPCLDLCDRRKNIQATSKATNAPATAVPTATPATVPAGTPFDGATDVVGHVLDVEDVLDVGDVVGEFDPEEPDSELVVMGPVDEGGLEEGMEPGVAGMKTVTGLEIVYAPIIVFVERTPLGFVNVSKVVDATNRYDTTSSPPGIGELERGERDIFFSYGS